ncbi:MarR family winged helix-turn-helix transcriptional regulator [Candidatus Soleaferrea massiliensis]|uniref:MarR family winged helix-turn-helix transcriptional regulator n=1 Tax=Candidatus Soleaferrea massiliensis TaxID=1470354 RepID=UPI00058FA1CC|nr:MarR family transcriptional regulator [Candidatus Soleaferrea massiliensis]
MNGLERVQDADKRFLIFGCLFLLSNKLQTIGNEFLGELTTKQWFLLLTMTNLCEQPPTIGELAGLMGCSHQNTMQIARKLQEKGFLRITKDLKDQRALRVQSTDRWRQYCNERREQDDRFVDTLFDVLDETELDVMRRCVLKLYDNLSDEGRFFHE